jgi:serine protease Do
MTAFFSTSPAILRNDDDTMKRFNPSPSLSLLLGLLAGSALEATSYSHITFQNGTEVIAEVIKEDPQYVVLDLGFELLRVPADQVLSIESTDGAEDLEEASGDQLYTTGRLTAAPVDELVQRFGDAVVMIKTPSGLGSGFFINEQGFLVTNYHVVERETNITVSVFDRTESGYERKELQKVKIIALHPTRDLALLKIEDLESEDVHVKPVVFAQDDGVQVGSPVFAVGNPLGLERSVSQGIVSSRTRALGYHRFIQTDAAINPGNSGGPLFNGRGEVVAVACAGSAMFDGLAFGIPVKDVIDFLENKDTYLYDSSFPQNGVKYLAPPFRDPELGIVPAKESESDAVTTETIVP